MQIDPQSSICAGNRIGWRTDGRQPFRSLQDMTTARVHCLVCGDFRMRRFDRLSKPRDNDLIVMCPANSKSAWGD